MSGLRTGAENMNRVIDGGVFKGTKDFLNHFKKQAEITKRALFTNAKERRSK